LGSKGAEQTKDPAVTRQVEVTTRSLVREDSRRGRAGETKD